MKHMKMLGLAAIAALGLMAFVGAGTASATTFFTDFNHTIAYPNGTTFHQTLKAGTSTAVKNTSGSTIATCTEGTLHGFLSQETGTWVSSSIGTLTWPAASCSQTTHTLVGGSLEFMQTSGNAATVVGKGTQVTLEIFGVSCTYGTGEGTTLGTITGGTAPELAINATLPKIAGGFLCPGSGVWTATWIFTAPHAVFFGP